MTPFHALECGYDVDTLFARMRQDLERLKAEGWQVVYPAPREAEITGAMREEPPQKPEHEHLQGGQ